MEELRVLDAQLLPIMSPPAPEEEEEEDEASGRSLSFPLTFFDVKWLHLPPVERVFLYRLLPHHDERDIIAGLKDSLRSEAVRAFFPLAGHVRLVPGRSDRHELFYRPGDGVHFTTAEYDADVDDLASDDPVRVSALAPLVPPLPSDRAVLAVQATVLRGGIAVGVTVHHSACDGRGSTHFLQTWAAAASGGGGMPMPPPPVIDRTLVPDPRGLYDTYLDGMPPIVRSPDLEFVLSKQRPSNDVAIATFTLSEGELRSIRDAVAGEAARRGRELSPRCSPLVAAYVLMWWCHCNCNHRDDVDEESGTGKSNKEDFYFLFSVDQRARMKPPVPDRYFGNCMCPAIAKVTRDDIIVTSSSPSSASAIRGGLHAACEAVAAAIEEEIGEGAQDRWDGCVARVKEAVANGTLSVAGSPRFRVYDMDMGFGRPAKVHIVSVAKTGAVSVADSRAGGRGLELGVSLPPHAMDRFRRCFHDAMESLRSKQ